MLPQATKVYFARSPADLRRSFDGLAATASAVLRKDPSAGGLFVFLNKRADQVRILFRDRHGWCILAKRLDVARFRLPRFDEDTACWETDAKTLMSFLEEIDVARSSRRAPSAPSPESPPHLALVQSELQ